jgi:cytochrome P450
VSTIIFAAQDTTRNQLGLAVFTFLEYPEQWTLLGDKPQHAGEAVEEVMRVNPTVPIIWRVATENVSFKGLEIPAGTFVTLVTATANTDPRVFGSLDFDITRQRPPQHTFGGGIHYCLGAALARAEILEALPILAARLHMPRLAGEVTWRPLSSIYGPVTLPISFSAR